MRTIAIINQKGGCGKTTTSINLAACLARLGEKTLLVDMDPQGHCAVGLAVPEEQIERTIYDSMIDESLGRVAKVSEIVWQIAADFDLAPSNIKLAAFEQVFAGQPNRESRLLTAIDAVKQSYKWCIIDCPPSVGLLTFNALRAADEVIVPVETGFFSLHGLAKMMDTLEIMRKQLGREISVRVLPTLYDTRTKLAREVLAELRSRFGAHMMASTVNFNTKLKEAASFGQPITEYDPGSRGYKDFVTLARELMGHRPTEEEILPPETLTRPQELVQRAKQLAQITNYQFGRGTVSLTPAAAIAESSIAVAPRLADLAPLTESKPPIKKTTEQKIEDFYGVKQVGPDVLFSAKFDEAAAVSIAGDFNNWSADSAVMSPAPNRPGEWRAALNLKPGRYRYRLVVDGQWITDPHNRYVETNQFGELNNIIEVD
ncbi:MAG TPA: AAA family ATPase [Tepidisphaeraceae bacterium]|jgi:chromosome partitioning protein|nr:AAA family ATPase [Tepidisphaeraceae bacterium]